MSLPVHEQGAPAAGANQPEVNSTVLEVRDLSVEFAGDAGPLRAVSGVNLSVSRGRTLALVGESGCGKSVTSYALLRLVQPPGRIVTGNILLHSRQLGTLDVAALRDDAPELFEVRGGIASLIFQEPMTALSPVHTAGEQVAEALRLHRTLSRAEARASAIEMLGKVGIPEAGRRFDHYPHEMSGGMRQRVVIAMALICRPELLIADEPTTALDVTLQAQILHLIAAMQRELGFGVLLITHDLAVVAEAADDVAVMYLGRIVEAGPVAEVLTRPGHPYTRGLLDSVPGRQAGRRLSAIPGSVPSLEAIPPGCPFHPRCAFAVPGRCDVGPAPAERALDGRRVACVRAGEILRS